MNWVKEKGDYTSHSVKPDFDSGKGWAWQKMTMEAKEAGTLDKFPRKPRRTGAEKSFWGEVDTAMSRKSFTMDFSIVNGRIVRE